MISWYWRSLLLPKSFFGSSYQGVLTYWSSCILVNNMVFADGQDGRQNHGPRNISLKEVTDKFHIHGQMGPLRIYPKTLTEPFESAPPRFISSSGSFPDMVLEEGLISIIQNLRIITTGF